MRPLNFGGLGPFRSVEMTLDTLFTGNMGRVVLTRVAVRLRKPELLKMTTTQPLDPAMIEMLVAARDAVKRG